MSKLNTIYIISKGRPHCDTAMRLVDMGYKGDWFIVVGNNDETMDLYKKIWRDKVIIFDWEKYAKNSDLMDNFGVDNKPSGAVPVRNAVKDISIDRGEERHWQFDDDIIMFYILNPKNKKWIKLNGNKLEKELNKMSQFASNTKLNCVGFGAQQDTFPNMALTVNNRVFNCFNFNNNDYEEWKGRIGDDLIFNINSYYNNKKNMSFKMYKIDMKPVENEKGGLFDLYKQDGVVRKLAYLILASPYNVKGIKKNKKIHYKINWKNFVPKLINEKFGR